jgi:hypothetical protein
VWSFTRAELLQRLRCAQAAEGPNGRRALKLTRATPQELAALAEKKRQARCYSAQAPFNIKLFSFARRNVLLMGTRRACMHACNEQYTCAREDDAHA